MRTDVAAPQNVSIHCKLVYSDKKEMYIIDRSLSSSEIVSLLQESIRRNFRISEFDFVDCGYKIKHPLFNDKPEKAPAMETHDFEHIKNNQSNVFHMYVRPITHQECYICYTNTNITEMNQHFQCTHRFCNNCVTSMIRHNVANCPMCRSYLYRRPFQIINREPSRSLNTSLIIRGH